MWKLVLCAVLTLIGGVAIVFFVRNRDLRIAQLVGYVVTMIGVFVGAFLAVTISERAETQRRKDELAILLWSAARYFDIHAADANTKLALIDTVSGQKPDLVQRSIDLNPLRMPTGVVALSDNSEISRFLPLGATFLQFQADLLKDTVTRGNSDIYSIKARRCSYNDFVVVCEEISNSLDLMKTALDEGWGMKLKNSLEATSQRESERRCGEHANLAINW